MLACRSRSQAIPGKSFMKRWSLRWFAVALLATGVARRAAADTIPADKLPETAVTDPATGPVGDYLRTLHAHIHRRWADNFLRLIGEKMPAVNPLNDAGKVAEVDLVVAADGQLLSAQVSRPSGFPGFDDAVVEVLRDAVPFPLPPPAARSDDDKLHVHWVFARDQRRCSGVSLVRSYDPVEVAIPKLLRTGRREEALVRVAMARGAGLHADPMFTVLARDWNKAALHEPWATPRMARMLAERGDDEAIRWLKGALRRPEWTAEAGAALVALKVPVCALVNGWFATDNWNDHKQAAVALATSPDPGCIPGLTKLLENAKAHPEARAAAATALGSIDDAGVHKTLANAAKDPNAAVRGAAMLAQIRPGAGRRSVIAMESFLRDPAPEVRAAAAAGVVRAGGDANLDDLYVLFKDNDPRPALAALHELDRVPSDASTQLVARLARRPQLPVQKTAAEILVRRGAHDAFATLRPYLQPGTDPELRALALVAAEEPALAAAAADPKLGLAAFRARLARGERDQAADLFVASGKRLTPADQATAMTYWIATAPAVASAPPAVGNRPTAIKASR
jgi:TonB family protein